MAGYGYFEDGGEVPDYTQDQYADPGDQAIPDQSNAADQYIGQPRSPVMAPHQALRNTAQAIIAYLHGDGAADPAQVKQVEQSVDPQGSMDPNQRTVEAIKAAADQGGPDAGFSFIQANRQQYNAKQSFARAALNGVQGKPADLNAAVNAANQAYYHVPNGEGVQFASTGNGVTATVNGQHFQLTPQQFDQWLDVGGKGQFDNVYENGAAKILGALTAQPQQQGSGDDQQEAIPPQPTAPTRPQVYGTDPGQNPGRGVPADVSKDRVVTPGAVNSDDYDDDLVRAANNMFPSVGQNAQRQAWLVQQQDARESKIGERQNKLDVENVKGNTQRDIWGERGKTAENVANTRATAYVQAADLKSQAGRENARARLAQIAQTADNERLRQSARLLSGKIMSNSVTPADEVQINAIIKGAPQSGGAAPAGGPAAQLQQGQTRQVGNTTYVKKSDGKWYPAGQ